MDILNEFFHRHYPIDAQTAWKLRSCGGNYGREYVGDRSANRPIFPEIVCADGFRFSAQGHFGAYSHPRDDFADEYATVEVMTAPDAEPMFIECDGHTNDEYSLYGYVPINVVLAVIEKHGGIAATVNN